MEAQKLVRRIPVGESVVEAILTLVRSGRPESSDIKDVSEHVAWAPGPRASQALMLAARARALLDGPARAVGRRRHRAGQARSSPPHGADFAARADGITIDQIIDRMCAPLA